jgi:hypothetical protein
LAYTKTQRSDDVKLVLISHFVDVTHEFAFCDVHWFPLQATQGAVAQPAVASPAVARADVAAEGAVLFEQDHTLDVQSTQAEAGRAIDSFRFGSPRH